MTKSRERKVPKRRKEEAKEKERSTKGRTCRQSERRGKCAGRRKTNDRRHRKGDPAEIAARAGSIREGDLSFDKGSPEVHGKKMGESTMYSDGVKGGGMHGKRTKATGESPGCSHITGVKTIKVHFCRNKSLGVAFDGVSETGGN